MQKALLPSQTRRSISYFGLISLPEELKVIKCLITTYFYLLDSPVSPLPLNRRPHPADHGSLDPIAASPGPPRPFWPREQPRGCQPAPLRLPLGGGSVPGVWGAGLLLPTQSPAGC